MARSQCTSTNTVLEVEEHREGTRESVFDVLRRPFETNLLVLSYRDSPNEWFRKWQADVGDLPAEAGFVHVGVKTRSATAVSAKTPAEFGPGNPTQAPITGPLLDDAVPDPTNLARLGTSASEYIESWDDNSNQTIVLLDSVTAMLDHVAPERAVQFLHLLGGRVESVEGRGYYLVESSAHDEGTLAAVRDLADATVKLDDARSE